MYCEYAVDAGLVHRERMTIHQLNAQSESLETEVRAIMDQCRPPAGFLVGDGELGAVVVEEMERRGWQSPSEASVVVLDLYWCRTYVRLLREFGTPEAEGIRGVSIDPLAPLFPEA